VQTAPALPIPAAHNRPRNATRTSLRFILTTATLLRIPSKPLFEGVPRVRWVVWTILIGQFIDYLRRGAIGLAISFPGNFDFVTT